MISVVQHKLFCLPDPYFQNVVVQLFSDKTRLPIVRFKFLMTVEQRNFYKHPKNFITIRS